jgi:hypothetical protein
MTAEFNVDAETTDLIVELLGGAAVNLGAPATVVVPAVALLKLGGRLAANGVTVPDNADLEALQVEMRTRGELPDLEG